MELHCSQTPLQIFDFLIFNTRISGMTIIFSFDFRMVTLPCTSQQRRTRWTLPPHYWSTMQILMRNQRTVSHHSTWPPRRDTQTWLHCYWNTRLMSTAEQRYCGCNSDRNKASPSDNDWLKLLRIDWFENQSDIFTLKQIV